MHWSLTLLPNLQSPETCIDIVILGHSKVGKSTFIRHALGSEALVDSTPPIRKVALEGEEHYLRVRERSIDDLDAKEPATVERAFQAYNVSSRRTDATIVVYDITRKESLTAVPLAIRASQKAGYTCIMASTKNDIGFEQRQLDPDAVERKTQLMVGDLKAMRPSIANGGPRKCLATLVYDYLHRDSVPQSPKYAGWTGMKHEQPKQNPSIAQVCNDSHGDSSSRPSSAKPHGALPPYIAVAVNTDALSAGLERQSSQNSEPFSPRTFQDASSLSSSDESSDKSSEALNQDTMKALPSLVIEVTTFEELVARVCFRDNEKADTRFDFNFLTFYRFFATPLRLLTALISVFTSTESADDFVDTDSIASRVLQFLSQWITIHPGDFVEEATYDCLENFLGTFNQGSKFFSVAEQIRMASGKIDEDDDSLWSLPNADESIASTSSEKLSRTRSNDTDTTASDLDAKLIFQVHSTVTLEAMGPSHTPANSVDQSSIPYNIANAAQRQSALLTPSEQLPFTKGQWRQLMAVPEGDIARELTRIDWIMFSAIQPRDMIRHITVPAKERPKFKELAHVTRMIEHFNHVAYWTTNLILLRDKPKHRALALEKLILIARKLRELNNYNSLGAIVAGIHGTAVHRLQATRDLVPPEVQRNFLKLEVLMSTQKGHASYRLAWENTSGPRVPFLPLHRRDLVVAEQGNKTFLAPEGGDDAPTKRLNWNKFNVLGSMLWDLNDAQCAPYKGYVANEYIKTLILDGSIIKDDDRLYERSQILESGAGASSGTSIAIRKIQPWLARYGLTET